MGRAFPRATFAEKERAFTMFQAEQKQLRHSTYPRQLPRLLAGQVGNVEGFRW